MKKAILLAALLLAAPSVKAGIDAKSDTYCLALTGFTEARDQGAHGMALVMHTVMTRARNRNKTPCQIAYQPNQYHGVLFWPRNKDPRSVNEASWSLAVRIANSLDQFNFGSCSGATHFYAPAVVSRQPRWSNTIPFKCTYRGHRFYG